MTALSCNGPGGFARLAAALLPFVMPAYFATDTLAAEDAPGAWAVASLSGPLSGEGNGGRWNFAADVQARYFDIGSGASQWLVRPSVGYRFANGVDVRVGYGRFRARSKSGRVADENRPWQEISFRFGRPWGGDLGFRGRLEQRSVDISDETNHTFRAMLRYRRNLGGAGTILELNVETFHALNDTAWAGPSGVIQARGFVGAGWPVTPRIHVGAGYLYQAFVRESAPDLVNHLAVVRVAYRFGD